MNYAESKKIIENLRHQDEPMFRMAISHLMDVGIRNLTPENVENTCAKIMTEDDKMSFMSNEYKCKLIRLAAKLAKINHIHLLVYISQNVFYDVEGSEMCYDEVMKIAKDLMYEIANSSCETYEAYNTFSEYCEISDEEIKQLGYGYLIPEEEKKYEN